MHPPPPRAADFLHKFYLSTPPPLLYRKAAYAPELMQSLRNLVTG